LSSAAPSRPARSTGLFAAGCGSSTSSEGPKKASNATGGPVKAFTIQETEFKLTPNHVSLTKPGTYEFKGVNKGTVGHALEIEGAGVEAKSETVDPGNTTTLKVTITKPGSYELYCPSTATKTWE
jgi:plastocyanin